MIETIISALAFGTIWFWLLAVITSIVFISSIENDHYFTPTIFLGLLGIIYWKPIMALSWQAIATILVGYVLVGIVWSLFKWNRYVNAKIKEVIERYGSWENAIKSLVIIHEISPSYNKSKLIGWIAWWPWSMFWDLSGDFFTMLYEGMTNAYQKITDNAISKVKNKRYVNNTELLNKEIKKDI